VSARSIIPLATALLLSVVFAACGGSSGAQEARVTIEPITATPRSAIPVGGKPATPPVAPTATLPPADDAPTEPPADVPTVAEEPTSTPAPRTLDGSVAPAQGRWIEVDVTNFIVRLMDGGSVVQEIGPVAVGEQVDTGEYASTQTGLFYVHNKIEELAYDPPYDTYISHWVGYDLDRANGFHSFLKDETGAVVDAGTGRISNGCVRTGAAEAIFAFAEIGMPVWVHW
jgi:hypothetical protein